MDQEYRHDKQRGKGHIQKGQQCARYQKGAQLLQVAQCLVFAARTVQGRPCCGTKNRRAKLNRHFDRGAHQDKPANGIQNGLKDHGTDDNRGQHQQRIQRPAGQYAVGNLEQVDRDRQDQNIGRQREQANQKQIAPYSADTAFQIGFKPGRIGALVEFAVVAAATTARTCGRNTGFATDCGARFSCTAIAAASAFAGCVRCADNTLIGG